MNKKRFTIEDAREVAATLGVATEVEDFYSYVQFAGGMNVELEHGTVDAQTNVTDDDPVKTAKIALQHLREGRTYYYHLPDAEKRAEADNDIFF